MADTPQPMGGGSLTDLLSAMQNGVVALSNLNKALSAISTTTISTSAGTTTTVIRVINVSS